MIRRTGKMDSADELNAYFASDPMVHKLGDLAAQLDALGDTVKAEELRGRLMAARQDAVRAQRDRSDLFEAGTEIIRLGNHRFSVNTQSLEATLLPRDGTMTLHLTGTGFYDPVRDDALLEAKDLWEQSLISESPEVYRGEYLAGSLLLAAEEGRDGLSMRILQDASLQEGGLSKWVRELAAKRYDEGYERGIHDEDAARILEKLLAMRATAGLLRFSPKPSHAMTEPCCIAARVATEFCETSWTMRERNRLLANSSKRPYVAPLSHFVSNAAFRIFVRQVVISSWNWGRITYGFPRVLKRSP